MMRSCLIGILVFLALTTSLPAQVPAPRAVRAVQVAAAESEEEARGVVDRAFAAAFSVAQRAMANRPADGAAGFGPVWTREEGGFVKVLVGRCERLPDAVLLKQALRRHGFLDAFERAFPDLVTGDFETEAWTPVAGAVLLGRTGGLG
ncbi:MAG: SPOR domain-containing protein [Candidatus Sumerlaeia bacterium]|nr:SPOR domain-containing protein [Candidatus Sumerlaeia bacterium]